MSVASKVGGTAMLVVGVVVAGSLLSSRPGDNRPPTHRAPRGGGEVRLVATWQRNRDMAILYTAGGVVFPEIVVRVSPWEHTLAANAGETVTFSVTPLEPGAGDHTCVIEHPPGRPLPGHGQDTASGPTKAFCSAVIGS